MNEIKRYNPSHLTSTEKLGALFREYDDGYWCKWEDVNALTASLAEAKRDNGILLNKIDKLRDMFGKSEGQLAEAQSKIEAWELGFNNVVKALAEAQEQRSAAEQLLKKYEGCVEVEGIAKYYGAYGWMISDLKVNLSSVDNLPVTVWVKRRTE